MQVMKSCWQCVEFCIPAWCWKTQSETGGLLPSGDDFGIKGQLYTVRRISSFGRTESKDDELDDGFLDKTSEVGSKCNLAGGVDTQLPVPWSSTAIPVQSGVTIEEESHLSKTSGSGKKSKKKKHATGSSTSVKQKQSWTRALGRVQKKESIPKVKQTEHTPSVTQAFSETKLLETVNEMKPVKSDEMLNGRTVTAENVSTHDRTIAEENWKTPGTPCMGSSDPNLLSRSASPFTAGGLASSSIELRSFGKSSTLSINHGNWMKSQSMQDRNTKDMQSVTQMDVSTDRDFEREAILREYGINLSHYSSMPQTKSSEALHKAWKSLEMVGKDDILQELPSGTVYFEVTCTEHGKKTVVNVNIDRLEKLSGKGALCEPYSAVVKLTILPGQKQHKVSRPIPVGASPLVKQQFTFTVPDISGKVLRISVYDQQWQGPYDAIGHVLFYLEDVPSLMDKQHFMKLYKQSIPDINPGNLQVSLSFSADKETLTVMVVQAHNLSLKLHKAKGKCKTYVKISYYSGGELVKEKQSSAVTTGQDAAVYNFATEFKIDSSGLQNSFVIIKLKLHNILQDKTIGRLILGPFFYTEGNSKLTPWGRAILDKEPVSHSFRLYL